MRDHLILTLEAPMIAFGGEAIDNRGVVRDFPARSMLTGLIANALGWDRTEGAALDALQARIDFAAARPREGHRSQEYQTARLFEKDAGWTTRGRPEGRASSPSFTWDDRWEAERGQRAKSLTHQRYRDFDADGRLIVALTLDPAEDGPGLDEVSAALNRPERPLFIGRKPFIPSGPICAGSPLAAPSAIHALALALVLEGASGTVGVQWSPGGSDVPGAARDLVVPEMAWPARDGATLPAVVALRTERRARVADERRHIAGVHGGSREVAQGALAIGAAR